MSDTSPIQSVMIETMERMAARITALEQHTHILQARLDALVEHYDSTLDRLTFTAQIVENAHAKSAAQSLLLLQLIETVNAGAGREVLLSRVIENSEHVKAINAANAEINRTSAEYRHKLAARQAEQQQRIDRATAEAEARRKAEQDAADAARIEAEQAKTSYLSLDPVLRDAMEPDNFFLTATSALH